VTLGLFYAKSDHELNNQDDKNPPIFPTVVYTPTNDRVVETVFWTDCSIEIKIHSQSARMGFFPGAEYQKGGKLSQLSISYLFSLIRQTV
jgi:hypothetical protein